MLNNQFKTFQDKILILILIFFSFYFFIPSTTSAQQATFFLFPSSQSFQIGEIFAVKLKLDTDFPINAAQCEIYFPPEKLEVLSISKENSIFSLWPDQPSFSNITGKISFSGGKPTPGFKGVGEIMTVNLKAKQKGLASLMFGEARILADDGKGTDILSFIKEAKFLIQKPVSLSEEQNQVISDQPPLPPKIFSLTHPEENEWYNNNNPQFQWRLTSDITGVSFLLDRFPNTIPDTQSEGILETKSYQNIENGIWYFHLRMKNKNGWSQTTHRKIQIDSQPPKFIEVIIDNAGDATNPNPNLYLKAKDDISGIDHFKLKIDDKDFLSLMTAEVNPLSLPFQTPGSHLVVIRVLDRARNATEEKTILNIVPIETPKITLLPKNYIAGEETFYIEGTALPEIEIIVLLEKNGTKIKQWSTSSNQKGQWSFSTRDLLQSGSYTLFVKGRDYRGVESNLSEGYEIQVKLSGFSFGPFMMTFQTLALSLFCLLLLIVVFFGYFFVKTQHHKKILENEIQEAKESVTEGFEDLKNKIRERIRLFDSKPEFSAQEREVYEELKKVLKEIEESIEKEVSDIENLERGIKKE